MTFARDGLQRKHCNDRSGRYPPEQAPGKRRPTRPEGGVIWVTGRRAADDAVEIAIMDEGPGIPAAEQARIFERYTQGDAAATRKQGMGLGLFIVRRIAEMHGGTAVCESEPGEGSTFRVTLRRCSAEDPAP